MMKKLMHGIVTGLAALTLSGCAMYLKPKDVPQDLPEYRFGMDGLYTKAKESGQLRTTPVHPVVDRTLQDRWAGWGEHSKADVLYRISDGWRSDDSLRCEYFDEKSDIESTFRILKF